MNFLKVKFSNRAKQTTILLGIVLLHSCGQAGGYKKTTTTFNSETSLLSTTNLSQEERNIATRICYSYESKAKKFNTTEYLGGKFNFSNSKTNCTDQTMQYNVVSLLQIETADKVKFSGLNLGAEQSFNGAIQTDKYGYLANVCYKIKYNQPISNTTVINGQTVQIIFSRTNLDTYTLNYFSTNNGITKIVMAETIKTRTQFDFVSGQILGMDEFYQKNAICSDGKKSSQFTQNYSGRN